MPASNVAPNLGTKVTIGGEERVIKYTMYGIRWLSEKYETAIAAFAMFQEVMSKPELLMETERLDALADIVAAGLMYDDPDITPDYVKRRFDIGEITSIIEIIVTEFMKSMQSQPAHKDKKKVTQA